MSSSLFQHVSTRLVDARLSWTDRDAGLSVPFVAEDDYLRRLGAVIRAARKVRRINQETLGERVGRDVNTISRWERGATSLSAYDLARLWEALDVPAEWFLSPTDSISELEQRAALLRRAAVEAARDAEGEEPALPSASATVARRGKH